MRLPNRKPSPVGGVDALVEALAIEGRLPYARQGSPHIALTTGERRGEGFWQWMKDEFRDLQYLNSRTILGQLKEWGCTRWHAGSQRGIAFPPLADLRAAFDAKHGTQKWDFEELKDWSDDPV
jgi:hypothetical protein